MRILKIFFLPFLLFVTTLWAIAFAYQKLFLLDLNSGRTRVQTFPPKTPDQFRGNPLARFPNSRVHWQFFFHGKMIFERDYLYDNYIFRVPLPEIQKSKFHVIIGGCSYAHGTGLEAHETIAHLLQQKLPLAKTYNLGFTGGGVTYLLKYFELYDPQKVVTPQPGVFFYVFMDDHVGRFYSRFRYADWAYPFAPAYGIEDGNLVYQGRLDQQLKIRIFNFLRLLQVEKVAVVFEGQPSWSEQQLHDFALAVSELKKAYLKKFPEQDFIFLFHPLSGFLDERLKRHLRDLGITYLDPRNDFFKIVVSLEQADQEYRIPLENHPNGKLNLWLSSWLASWLTEWHQKGL